MISSEKLDSLLLAKPTETRTLEAMIQQIEATRTLVDVYRTNKGEFFEDDTELGYAYDCLTKAAEVLEDELVHNPWPYAAER